MRRRLLGALALLGAVLAASGAASGVAAAEDWAAQRRTMVEEQLRPRGIQRPDVLAAMGYVPRHRFVPESVKAQSYEDQALSLGSGRTVYQPYVVALMTSLLDLKKGDRVLEVGTGSGYQAAVLSRVAREVYSIEIVPSIADQARRLLSGLGYTNVEILVGDGYQGWASKGPFDAILLSAAPPRIPKPLMDQLRVGGKMVVPVGGGFFQDLLVITKTADGVEKKTVIPVRLSPMTGKVRDGQ